MKSGGCGANWFLRWVGLGLTITTLACAGGRNISGPVIGVAQFVDHPALDATRQGFRDEMARLGYDDAHARFDYQNAEGDMVTARSIAQRFAGGGYDLIFCLATPMAQMVKKVRVDGRPPIVFGAITDPVSAGLVETMAKPGDAITGTSDQWPYEGQLALFREVVTGPRGLCIVFNPGEDNTRYAMQQTRAAAAKLQIRLIEAPISGITDIYEAASSIAGRCDAFYVPADNTAMAGAATIIRVADARSIPVIAGDAGTFDAGSLIALGVSYQDLGVQSARLAERILKEGKRAGDLPVIVSQKPQLMVNIAVARRLGLKMPESILKRADRIVTADPRVK